MKERRWISLVRSDDSGHDVSPRRSLVGVALASAHIVGGATCHRRDEHATEPLPDLCGVRVVEKGDPLTANLIAARYDRFGEHMNEASQIRLIRQSILEAEARRPEGVPHTLGVDAVARDGVADPEMATRIARVAENDNLAVSLLAAGRCHRDL